MTNEATEMWGGICKCGYRNIFTISESGYGYDQRIEKVKAGKFKRPL